MEMSKYHINSLNSSSSSTEAITSLFFTLLTEVSCVAVNHLTVFQLKQNNLPWFKCCKINNKENNLYI